jgi:hypothetical protein
MFVGIDTFSTKWQQFLRASLHNITLKTEKEGNVKSSSHGDTVSFVGQYEEKEDGDHFDMALPYLLILYYRYGFYEKKKKTAEKSTYHERLRIGLYRIFNKEMRRRPRSHITAEPSLYGEWKILVCYETLLIKQYSMQKILNILSHWLVIDLWMNFLDAVYPLVCNISCL